MPSINDAHEVQVLGSNANNDEEDLGRSEMLNLGHAEQESRVMILSENIGAHVLTEERKEEDLEPEQSMVRNGQVRVPVAASNSDFTVRIHASVENVITQANEELRAAVNANADVELTNPVLVAEG